MNFNINREVSILNLSFRTIRFYPILLRNFLWGQNIPFEMIYFISKGTSSEFGGPSCTLKEQYGAIELSLQFKTRNS
jgi:hypothetical protein